jgi:hypothetical protein
MFAGIGKPIESVRRRRKISFRQQAPGVCLAFW